MNIYDTIVSFLGFVPEHLIFIYDIAYIFVLISIMIVILAPFFFVFSFVRGR